MSTVTRSKLDAPGPLSGVSLPRRRWHVAPKSARVKLGNAVVYSMGPDENAGDSLATLNVVGPRTRVRWSGPPA
jgi:hypothetical protein